MTISNTNRIAGPFLGNGVTLSFPLTFKVFSPSEVLVVRANSTGIETILALTSDYTVALNPDQNASPGGTVTPVSVLATGLTLTLSSALPYLQPVDLTNQGGFYPTVINNALDRLTIFCQQIAEALGRSLKTAISTPAGFNATLPAPAANRVIGWNPTGTGFQNYAPVDNTLLAVTLAAPTGAELIGSNDQVVASITALRALLKTSASKNAFVTGYYTAGDGGGGAYWYDAADTTTADNGGTVIVATDGGRWKLAQTAMVSVKQFGAKGDGTTNDTGVFNACITALSGHPIYVPDPSSGYKITSMLTLPDNTVLVGVSKRSTKIIRAFNGDMVTLGDGAGLQNIWLEGNGVNGFTGRGVLLTGTAGHQEVMNSRIVNTLGFPVDYTGLAAGSQSLFSNVEMNYYGATTGSSNVAVNMLAGFQGAAVPRTFVNIQTNGAPSFNFGGCNGVFISGSFLADLIYTTNSRDVQITNTRLANQAALVIDGHNNGVVGCDINAQVTIAAGADAITVGPNSYNNLPIIDGSGNNRNNLHHWSIAYTPSLGSGGTAPVLGNGTLTGTYSREGSTVTATINLVMGSTTTLGTGGLNFGLPFFRSSADIVECGNMVMNRGGTVYMAVMQISGAANTAQPIRDTSGSVTFNSPATWAAGDTMRATMTFGV